MKRRVLYGSVAGALAVSLLIGPTMSWADEGTPSLSSPAPLSSQKDVKDSINPADSKNSEDKGNKDSTASTDSTNDDLKSVPDSVLGEFGIDLNAIDKAQEVSEKASTAYAKHREEVKNLQREARELEVRITVAQKEADNLKKESVKIKDDLVTNKKMVGRTAAYMYIHGTDVGTNLSASINPFSADAMDKLDSMNTMERVMKIHSSDLASSQELNAEHDSLINRQKAVNDDLARLKKESNDKLAKAKKEEEESRKLKEQALEALEKTKKAQADARSSYEKSFADAKAQQAQIDAIQRELMKKEGLKASDFDPNSFDLGSDGDNGKIFPLTRPVPGNTMSSGFGYRPTPPGTIDYGGHGGYVHAGQDYPVACGTPVRAPLAGAVLIAGPHGTSGNEVFLNHGKVGTFLFSTGYHHLSKVIVHVGQTVKKGELLGYSGNTGNSTGCHLHFETHVNGKAVDPVTFLK